MNWIRFNKFILKNCIVIGVVFLFILSRISNTKVMNSILERIDENGH